MAHEYIDEIVEKLIEFGRASDDLYNDYDGGHNHYHHESHVDRSYTLLEAANLLDQLSRHWETDNGLWEGQLPINAIAIQAAYTYGNAVYFLWTEIIGYINQEYEFRYYPSDTETLTDSVRKWISDA